MSRTLRVLGIALLVVAFGVASGASARSGQQNRAPTPGVQGALTTAFSDSVFGDPDVGDLALRRAKNAGASAVRFIVHWIGVAPSGSRKPRGFNAENPFDPLYQWDQVDRQVRLIVAAGLVPIAQIYGAPTWAQGRLAGSSFPLTESQLRERGAVRPSPRELAFFATAAARRYSGRFAGLPRIGHWMLWNEPNLVMHLAPQVSGTTPVSPYVYRSMVNAFADAIHAVRRDNVVIAGGTAPFTSRTGRKRLWGLGPLRFMRLMLCMSERLTPTCRARARFDVWAHHPYTSGGPTHKAFHRDDVSLGDLPEMRRLLDAAIRARRITSRRAVRFWATEFGWDTNPPDPKGVPMRLHARWTAEALYRMWQSGISLVNWLQIRDEPFKRNAFVQSGLYFRGRTIYNDRPKLSLRAFRFPFVAFGERGRVLVWGRTPTSRPGRVLIEQTVGGGWKRTAALRANRHGIFVARIAAPPKGSMRARYLAERSVPFSLRRVPDRFVRPFGTNWDD